jgi:prolipoprotein diacylglyceryltransferase
LGSCFFPGVMGKRFPLSLYESLFILISLWFILFFKKRYPNYRDSLIFFLTLVFYGFNLVLLESFRINDIYLIFTIRSGFILGIILISIGFIGLYRTGFFIFLSSLFSTSLQFVRNTIKLNVKKEI